MSAELILNELKESLDNDLKNLPKNRSLTVGELLGEMKATKRILERIVKLEKGGDK